VSAPCSGTRLVIGSRVNGGSRGGAHPPLNARSVLGRNNSTASTTYTPTFPKPIDKTQRRRRDSRDIRGRHIENA